MLRKYVSLKLACISMYKSKNWKKIEAFLLVVAYLPISQFCLLCR